MAHRGRYRSIAALLLALGACEIEKASIPRTASLVAVHGVLSASASSQVILLERTRSGSVQLISPPFDLSDPVMSDEGIAESGATISLQTPGGHTFFGREDAIVRGDSKGRGIYRFEMPGAALERNGTYRLSVFTRKGELLSAETIVPGGEPALNPELRVFDRSRDTLMYEWSPSPGARSYFVRIDTPFGPRSFFTDSTRVRLTGQLRNVDVDALPHVFIPGFPQAITVSAVDSNYYDWYRTHNDALSGRGLINRVHGGLGVFGSLVRLRFQEVSVVAPQPEQAAGTFTFTGTPAEQQSTQYLRLELYVESRSARDDQGDAISGRYQKRTTLGNPGCPVCGVLGTVKDGHIELNFLRDWYASDTVERFTGEVRGDTIVGQYRLFGGPVRFVKSATRN
jgi:hypothetical protein